MPLAQIGAVIALALSALPPPPDKVVFQTRMYGAITVDHRLHLANRVSCRKCHGDAKHMAGSTLADGRPLPIDQYERRRSSAFR